ncbi:MAG TPA: hypothetical protein VJ953_13280 [Saprospiraceae bacterium]|nr:hypothetical protein [Saprospiraceae bacterium]
MPDIHDIPLLPFFLRWRHYERSYGRLTSDPETFLLLLEELARGYGLFTRADLLILCKTVLLKPGHEEQDFERMFNQYLRQIQARQQEKDTARKSDAEQPTDPVDTPADKSAVDATDNKPAESPTEAEESKQTSSSEELVEQGGMISIYFEEAGQGLEGIQMDSSQRDISELIFQKSFIIQGDDYLLPTRVLQQAWRSMRNLQEVGVKRLLDLDKTIRQVANTGFLGKPALRADYQNTAQLTILIDDSPSMVAFAGLAEKMIRTATQDRHFQDLRVFYFDNVPEDYLFRSPGLQNPVDIADFLLQPRSSVLVFSDAGAARGMLNWDRVSETLAFIKLINAPHFVWVNPIPRKRWEHSSAELIALKTGLMFSSNPLEFRNAIKQLRGKLRSS